MSNMLTDKDLQQLQQGSGIESALAAELIGCREELRIQQLISSTSQQSVEGRLHNLTVWITTLQAQVDQLSPLRDR